MYKNDNVLFCFVMLCYAYSLMCFIIIIMNHYIFLTLTMSVFHYHNVVFLVFFLSFLTNFTNLSDDESNIK